MSFGFYRLKTFLSFLICLFFALALPLYPAQAFVEWLGKVIIGGILWIICMIPILIGAALTSLAGNFLVEVTNPSFITKRYIEIGFVKEGWMLCANLAGIFLVLALIAIGVAVALRMIKEPGKALIQFVTAAILIPFTPIIAGFMIDFANIFTFTFFRTGAAQGFFNGINLLQAACDSFSSMFAPGAGFLDGVGGMLGALIFLALFGIMLGITLFRFGIMLFARYVALWIIIILSPLAFCFLALSIIPSKDFPPFQFFSKLGKYHGMWWENLFGWATIGILGSFFIYIAGMTSNFLATTDSDLVNSGWFYQLIGENLLPYMIPLFILYMGYNLTMEWAPAAAKQIVDGVEGAIKTTATVATAAVGGLAMKGASSFAASKTGQAMATKMQTAGADLMEKKGGKTLGYALNRVGSNIGRFGAEKRKEMEDTQEKNMKDWASADKGATLGRMKLPAKTFFNNDVIEAQEKGRGKALLEQYKKEYDKGKIKHDDPRLMDMIKFATGENDKETLGKIFKEKPSLMNSDNIDIAKAKGLLIDSKTKDKIGDLSKSVLDKFPNINDAQKKAIKDVLDPTKLTDEKALDSAQIPANAKANILQARNQIIEMASKSAKETIAKTLKAEDVSKMDVKDIRDKSVADTLSANAPPSTLWARITRIGKDGLKDTLDKMDKTQKEALFRGLSKKDWGELDRDVQMSPEMMEGLAKYGFSGGKGKGLASQIFEQGNANEINDFISLIKQNPRAMRSLANKFDSNFISNINTNAVDNVLSNPDLIKGITVNGGKKNISALFSEGGAPVLGEFSQAINTDEDFRKQIIATNHGDALKSTITPMGALSGSQIQMPQPDANGNPVYMQNYSDLNNYIQYYKQEYSIQDVGDRFPRGQNQNNQQQSNRNNQQRQSPFQNQTPPQNQTPAEPPIVNQPTQAPSPMQAQQNVRQNIVNNPSPLASQNQGQRIGGYQSLAQDIEDDGSDQGFSKTKYE